MKHTLNLLSEILAFPFSDEFLKTDKLANCVQTVQAKVKAKPNWDFNESHELEKLVDEMAIASAAHIQLHTDIDSPEELISLFRVVFPAKTILALRNELKQQIRVLSPQAELSPRMVSNSYYLYCLKKIAKTFLTTRNGRVAFKYWNNSGYELPTIAEPVHAYSHNYAINGMERYDRIEIWHSILHCIPEDLMISSFAAYQTVDARACYQNLLHMGDTVQMSDLLLDKVLSQGLAETHLHAGASRSFGLIWEAMLRDASSDTPVLKCDHDLIYQSSIKKLTVQETAKEAWIVRALLTAALASGSQDLQKWLGANVVHKLRQPFCNLVEYFIAPEGAQYRFIDFWTGREQFLISFETYEHNNIMTTLLGIPEAVHVLDPAFCERLFMSLAIMHIRDVPCDVGFSCLFIYYLRMKNISYRQRVQDTKNKGLRYFQPYYNSSTDSTTQGLLEYVDLMRTALKDSRVVKTEFRFSPFVYKCADFSRAIVRSKEGLMKKLRSFIASHLFVIALLYGTTNENGKSAFIEAWRLAEREICNGQENILRRLLEEFGVSVATVPTHVCAVIFHLIKHGEQHEGGTCFLNSRGHSDQARFKHFSFGQAQFEYQCAVEAIHRVRNLCPEICRIIVGIDAASQEIPTEPWVFGPALRTIRTLDLQPYCEGAQNSMHKSKKQTLGLTYHVGEDFRHPLSGLRHTSEAITLFHMHSGDRLGHALALGIDLNRWFSGCGLTAVPRIERMENCIWAWKALSETPNEGKHLNFLQYLENRILKYAKDIYGTLNGITVENLYNAYMCKALPHSELEQIAVRVENDADLAEVDCFLCHGNPTFYPCATEAKRNGQAWWSEDALSMSYHCDFYKSRMNEIIIEEPTAEETAITYRMQSYVRRQAASVGLIIESNPSSNATIGEMNGILNHPLLTMRTQCDDAPAVMVSVNTDDPSLFNASVPNEYAYIYFALLHNGYTVEQALEEINQLRYIGLHSSFIKEIPTFENLLHEYEKVLYTILARE